MIAASEGTKEKFLNAQRIDMTVEVVYERIMSYETPDTTGSEDQSRPSTASAGTPEQSQISNAGEAKNHRTDLEVYQSASNGIVSGPGHQVLDLDSILSATFGQTSPSTE